MIFRTEVNVEKSSRFIKHGPELVLLGSCFTDHIGSLLTGLKFNALVNPFGVVFNPEALGNLVERSLDLVYFQESECVWHNGLWHLMDVHGQFSNFDKMQLLQNANSAIEKTNDFLLKASHLIVTFGTAWVYQYNDTGKIVGNCHKLPANIFTRYRLTIETIAERWTKLSENIRLLNPNVTILYTVSPVRHLKDTAHGNQLSKSVLLLAIDQIIVRSEPLFTTYFPAYEMLMDDLRDYRFYDSDMVHVNNVAVQYVFKKFSETYFDRLTQGICDQVFSLNKAVGHRVQNNEGSGIEVFASKMLDLIELIGSQSPNIDLQKEKDYFTRIMKLS